MVEDVDVVIIGAGAAGLTAAYDLHYDSNYTYRILEASSGLGGRLRKLEGFADFPIDLGAEFIHVSPDILNVISGDDDDTNVTDVVETTPYVKWYREYRNRRWVRTRYPDDDYKFVNCTWFDFFNDYIALPNVLDDNLVLNCQVDEIDWSSTPVKIRCSDEREWTAKHVIVTVSIKVLQENDIAFNPALPERTREAVNNYIMMPGIKVFIKFEEQFYKTAFEFASDYRGVKNPESVRYFYDATYGQDSQENILGVLAVGELAEPFLHLPEQEILDSILGELDAVYNGKATINFIEGFVQNWNNETFVLGAYTHLPGDDDEAFLSTISTLRDSLEDRIFFAGEAIPADDLEWGYAHGAALSGRSASAKIMELLDEEIATGDN